MREARATGESSVVHEYRIRWRDLADRGHQWEAFAALLERVHRHGVRADGRGTWYPVAIRQWIDRPDIDAPIIVEVGEWPFPDVPAPDFDPADIDPALPGILAAAFRYERVRVPVYAAAPALSGQV